MTMAVVSSSCNTLAPLSLSLIETVFSPDVRLAKSNTVFILPYINYPRLPLDLVFSSSVICCGVNIRVVLLFMRLFDYFPIWFTITLCTTSAGEGTASVASVNDQSRSRNPVEALVVDGHLRLVGVRLTACATKW